MINQDKAEKALNYLADTDEEYAELYREKVILEKSEKRILAIGFSQVEGSAAKANELKYTTQEYSDWVKDYANMIKEYETMKAQRERAKITIDFWRSLNANRRQGNV